MARKLYLVSSLGYSETINDKRIPKRINDNNNLIENLLLDLNLRGNIVIIPSTLDKERNALIKENLFKSLELSGIHTLEPIIIDESNKEHAKEIVDQADLVFISDGNPLEQMKLLNSLGLKEILQSYNGIILVQSTAAINCAKKVVCAPETEENMPDIRVWDGIGLTDINIMPHFNINSNDNSLVRGELLNLSFGTELVALPDGSYIKCENNKNLVNGEAYLISNGEITKISEDEEIKPLPNKKDLQTKKRF